MKQHRYQITVAHIALPDGNPPPEARSLQFETGNHDDILSIIDKVRQRGDMSEADATAFAVGLKLFSEVMLQNRQLPLFADFVPHFKQFMQQLKQRPEA